MMPSLAVPGTDGRRSILARPYPAVFVILALGWVVPFCLRGNSDWESVYVLAGRHLRDGQDVFQNAYLYPPAFALAAVPFSYLPHLPGRLAWYVVNLLGVGVLLRGAWHLAGGPSFLARGWRTADHLALLAGLAGGVWFTFDAFSNQQTDLLIAGLCMGGCLFLARGRDLSAGLLFGVAAGLKCTPLLWGPYLAWRGRWRAAALVFVAAVGVNLLPDLVYPPDDGQPRLAEWVGRYLTPMARPDHDPGTWGSLIHFNHSVAGVANRWLTGKPDWSSGRLLTVPRAGRLPAIALKAVVYGSAFFLVGLAVLAAGRRPRPQPGEPRPLEWGLVLMLMVLLSPMSSKPHFCTLLLPAFCLARLAVGGKDFVAAGCLVAAAVAGFASAKDLVGCWVYDRAVWGGSVFWSTVFLFAGSCLASWRTRAISGVAGGAGGALS
jgi:hypothetical protein